MTRSWSPALAKVEVRRTMHSTLPRPFVFTAWLTLTVALTKTSTIVSMVLCDTEIWSIFRAQFSEGKCPDKLGSSGNILNFCEVGLKISGPYPLVANPIYTTNHEAITSVYYSDILGYSNSNGVLVLGTSLGTSRPSSRSTTRFAHFELPRP